MARNAGFSCGSQDGLVPADSRLWHSGSGNASDEPRVAAVASIAPWWLCCEFGGRPRAVVPRQVYDAMPPAAQPLFRHRVEGVGDLIQQPRPFDGWRMDGAESVRMDNGWVKVAGVPDDFVDRYYEETGAVPDPRTAARQPRL